MIKDIVPAVLTPVNDKIEATNSNSALKRQGADMMTTFDKACGIEDQSMRVFDSIKDTLQDLGDLGDLVTRVQETAPPEINDPTDEVHSVELF